MLLLTVSSYIIVGIGCTDDCNGRVKNCHLCMLYGSVSDRMFVYVSKCDIMSVALKVLVFILVWFSLVWSNLCASGNLFSH